MSFFTTYVLGGIVVTSFIIDFLLLAVVIIGITALNGIITNVFGMKIFGRGQVNKFTSKTSHIQSGWKQVGGKK